MHNYKQSSKERAVNYIGQHREQWIAEYVSFHRLLNIT